MGDMGDDFRALKEYKKEKRASNTESSTAMLENAGVKFESKNGGAHLVVHSTVCVIDFWPSTGLWIKRGTTKRNRGVHSLLRYLQPKSTASSLDA